MTRLPLLLAVAPRGLLAGLLFIYLDDSCFTRLERERERNKKRRKSIVTTGRILSRVLLRRIETWSVHTSTDGEWHREERGERRRKESV